MGSAREVPVARGVIRLGVAWLAAKTGCLRALAAPRREIDLAVPDCGRAWASFPFILRLTIIINMNELKDTVYSLAPRVEYSIRDFGAHAYCAYLVKLLI